ncbi:MAG: MarR family transcriptional regulator [Pseudomonadota bacterium]
MTEFKLDQFLPYQMAVLAGRLSRGLSEIYETRFGLSIADWRVLAHLHDAGSCSVREIHVQADMEKSRVSRAVTRLESRGLVARAADGADKRLLRLTLSDEGTEMVAEILPLALAYEARVLEQMGDKDALRAALNAAMAATDSD